MEPAPAPAPAPAEDPTGLSPPDRPIDRLIPPNELKDLQAHEVPRLMDAAETGKLSTIAERLITAIVHCPDVNDALRLHDLRALEYRNEVLVCALWILSLVQRSGAPPRVCDIGPVQLAMDADMSDAEANTRTVAFVLAAGSDTEHAHLYRMALGRCMALMAHNRVHGYVNKLIAGGVNTDHGMQARQVAKIITNMAKSCTAWKRSKDRYLFQQVRTRLTAARLAQLVYLENPMGAIAAQLDHRDTNKTVGRYITEDIGRLCTVSDWKTTTSLEIFTIAVSVMQEVLDTEVPFLVNTEIPYHRTLSVPAFVVLSNNFATRGTRFGYVWNDVMYFVNPLEEYPIPETILGWLDLSLQVAHAAALQSLHLGIVHPETVMSSDKMAEFVH